MTTRVALKASEHHGMKDGQFSQGILLKYLTIQGVSNLINLFLVRTSLGQDLTLTTH